MIRTFTLLCTITTAGLAQAPATRAVYLDSAGVVRWADDRQEVALFGANYVLPTASDYRAAGYVGGDRKRMIDEDMAHFARMGWDAMRLTFWGDWEASDSAGNLIANDHLDLLDYQIAVARARGLYLLLSPIQLYSSNWPDAMARDPSTPGFGRVFGRERMGKDPAAIASQVNYLRQVLNHVNPYTGTALKDEPAILFLELVNEPWHHPDDLDGSVRYLNALTDAVRATGCRKLVFYNVSQDFRIGEAIRRSRVQGLTFGRYPTGLNSGFTLPGNHLRTMDEFPDMLRPELARLPRLVYEFDSADLNTGTMYPAMVRTFRTVGSQMTLMFAYDMLATASRNLGWQTHYLNLVYTPRKAMSAVIAAEAMRRLPRMRSYGPYPENTRFGSFRVSYEDDLSELVTRDLFLHAGTTRTTPPDPAALRRIAGYGSSPIVRYEGLGTYFLDRVREGTWRLEVYPDAVPVRDPFEPPNANKVVTRAISRAHPMTVTLPDLGSAFTVQAVAGDGASTTATEGRFVARPGVYLLNAAGTVDLSALPSHVGRVGLAEFHPPRPDTVPPVATSLAAPELLADREAVIRVRVVEPEAPDSVALFVRPAAGGFWRGVPMRPDGAYQFAAALPAGTLREGPAEFVVSRFRNGTALTLPGGVARLPWQWDYYDGGSWRFDVVPAGAPLSLFEPARDAQRLAFTRIGDAGRRGLFRLAVSPVTGATLFHFPLPVTDTGWSPSDYTASLAVVDRIRARQGTLGAEAVVSLRVRGLGPGQAVHVTLMEDDGTSWTAAVPVDTSWAEPRLPLSAFRAGRGVMLPQGFPGEWSYWVEPAAGRGGAGDHPRVARIERLQLSLRREAGVTVAPEGYGVDVEWVRLLPR